MRLLKQNSASECTPSSRSTFAIPRIVVSLAIRLATSLHLLRGFISPNGNEPIVLGSSWLLVVSSDVTIDSTGVRGANPKRTSRQLCRVFPTTSSNRKRLYVAGGTVVIYILTDLFSRSAHCRKRAAVRLHLFSTSSLVSSFS